MPIKFLVLVGGGIWGFLEKGGGKCRFYFYGREDFSDHPPPKKTKNVFDSYSYRAFVTPGPRSPKFPSERFSLHLYKANDILG